MSPSVARKSPTRRHSRRSVSPERDYDSLNRKDKSSMTSSRSRSPSRRERSPARRKISHRERGSSPPRERHSNRIKSPKREKSSSPVSRSPSPRTKRLRKTLTEKEPEKVSEKERSRNHDKGGDKSKRERSHKDKDMDMDNEVVKDRREKRSERERDATDAALARSRHRRSGSPSNHHRHRSRNHSQSPTAAANSRPRDEDGNLREAENRNGADDSLSKMEAAEQALATKEKDQPSFELSGKLAAETNRVRGITLLFNEPPDARKPDVRWRLYVFKNGEVLNEPLYVHRQSCYLFGRERRVADIPTDHPSCSKQHAVLQFRQVEKEQPDGMMSKKVRPYMMDLGSTNKTFVNENPIEPQRYYELFEKDTIKFGNSSREYVLLHENSA